MPATVSISHLVKFVSSVFAPSSTHPSTVRSTTTINIPMLSPLTWAILALTLPFSMAQRVHHDVKWEDLMVATSQFPRFFGEPANITRTGDAKVHAMYLEDGTVMSMNCYNTVVKGEWLRCDVDCDGCVTMTDALLDGIDQAQQWFKPDLNNLTFVLRRTDEHEGEDGWWFRTFFFDQTNLGGKIEIDNAIVQLYLVSP